MRLEKTNVTEHLVGEMQTAETVYENSFSSDESDGKLVTVYGEFEIRDGALRTTAKSGYSVAVLDIGNFTDFVFEVDFVSHTGGGGIIFLCDSERAKLKRYEDTTNGYMAYIGNDGTFGAIGCASPIGNWSGNFAVGNKDSIKAGADLHLYLRVSGDFFIYTVTDIKTGEEVYRYEYRKADSRYDHAPYETGSVALRMNNDGGVGGFTNIKLRRMKKPKASESTVLKRGQKLECALIAAESEELVTLVDENGSGYAFSFDASVERALVYSYDHGEFFYLAEHAMKITKGREYAFAVTNENSVVSFYFADMTYPIFQAKAVKNTDYIIGSTAPVKATVSDFTSTYTGRTYTNPVAHGADPEVLYHDGMYYLYNLDRTEEPNRVRVRVSSDLVVWREAGFCFIPDDSCPITTFMSPNVFFKDGIFYLLIASHVGGTGSSDYRVFYATADSPTGPFSMKGERPFVNYTQEIGGAPFIDDDGKVYLTFVRFGGGNHVYIQEIEAKDGIITPVGEAVHCISPTEHYEIDEYGRISEGGVIVKHNDYYYMMYASGHFRGHYGEAYAVSRNIFGPYEKYKYNEALCYNAYVDGAGDCVFVKSPDGDELFVVYHRHTKVGNKGYDRCVCIDRVYFVPSEDGGPDVLRVVGPTYTKQPVPRFAMQ